ncbi:conjugal transfer protein TraF, partial [bacterium]|nr:conjugal transfer protein TraF [bacterium]
MIRLAVIVFLLALAMPIIVLSAPPTPSQIGQVVMGADAGIVGMGGAGVALCDSPYAPYWNPAGLALLKGAHMPFNISARVENIDTIEDWSDLVDIFDKDNPTVDDFNKARDIAKKVSNKAVLGEINPYFALAGNRFAVSFYGQAMGKGFVTYSSTGVTESIQGNLAGYYLSNFTFSIAGGKNKNFWGINLRSISGKYSPYERTLTYDGTKVTTTPNPFKEETSSAFGLDFGMLWLGKDGTRYGLVLKNINSPKLFSGANELKLDTDMDVGWAKIYPNGILAAQWTNM